MIYQRRGCGISLSRQVCIARPILSVKELNAKDHMHSRLLSAPILATAKGAGPPWQWPLCDPDPQARLGSGPGPGDGPVVRQPLGGVVGDAEAVAGPACSSSELPPFPESRQSPSPRCYMLAAAQRPLSMCLASSPRHHLRPSTAHYVARRSAPNRRHFSALATRCTPLFYPQDPSFPPPSCGHVYPQMRAFGDKQYPAQPAPVQHSEFCPPSPPPCQTWSVRSEAPTWASPTF